MNSAFQVAQHLRRSILQLGKLVLAGNTDIAHQVAAGDLLRDPKEFAQGHDNAAGENQSEDAGHQQRDADHHDGRQGALMRFFTGLGTGLLGTLHHQALQLPGGFQQHLGRRC
ncbi:hypothetical protein D3C76_814170 [compost metagenome]